MTAMALKDKLTEGEMEVVMSVFRQYETGLREACIDVKVNVSIILGTPTLRKTQSNLDFSKSPSLPPPKISGMHIF